MEEADFLCDRIGFINRGKIIAIDTPSKLKTMINRKVGGDIVKLTFKNTKKDNANIEFDGDSGKFVLETIKGFDFVNDFKLDNNVLTLTVKNARFNLPVLLKVLDNVESVEFSETTLNDVFYKFTNENISEQPEGGFMEKYAQYD